MKQLTQTRKNEYSEVDLSCMNLVDTVKAVTRISAEISCANPQKICKCRLSSEQVLNFISGLPIPRVFRFEL